LELRINSQNISQGLKAAIISQLFVARLKVVPFQNWPIQTSTNGTLMPVLSRLQDRLELNGHTGTKLQDK
jgi:hypothetical protein